MKNIEDKKLLIGLIGASIATYNIYFWIRKWQNNREQKFVPIGTIKKLYIYPAKSCKPKEVFSFYTGAKGPIQGENKDRHFQVINGDTGLFYTARQKPQMVLLEVSVENGFLTVKVPNGKTASVSIDDVRQKWDVRETVRTTSTSHNKQRTDGLDCGDEISIILSEYLKEPNTRMVMYTDELYTERYSVAKQESWKNNEVPSRTDSIAFHDYAPYLIQTEASLNELNKRLDEENQMSQLNFRPVIVIDNCPAWDEDKWLELRIGNALLQCYRPCDRCTLTTVNPQTGEKNRNLQPLAELRKFRLAPEGVMRKTFKDSPIFGVMAGVEKSDHIYVGQVVYANYKKSDW